MIPIEVIRETDRKTDMLIAKHRYDKYKEATKELEEAFRDTKKRVDEEYDKEFNHKNDTTISSKEDNCIELIPALVIVWIVVAITFLIIYFN